MATGILVVVRVNAVLPVVLYTHWAPDRLESIHKKGVGEGWELLFFLGHIEQRRPSFLASVGECASLAPAAVSHFWIRGTEAALVYCGVVERPRDIVLIPCKIKII
jgi:hypothetical protein